MHILCLHYMCGIAHSEFVGDAQLQCVSVGNHYTFAEDLIGLGQLPLSARESAQDPIVLELLGWRSSIVSTMSRCIRWSMLLRYSSTRRFH